MDISWHIMEYQNINNIIIYHQWISPILGALQLRWFVCISPWYVNTPYNYGYIIFCVHLVHWNCTFQPGWSHTQKVYELSRDLPVWLRSTGAWLRFHPPQSRADLVLFCCCKTHKPLRTGLCTLIYVCLFWELQNLPSQKFRPENAWIPSSNIQKHLPVRLLHRFGNIFESLGQTVTKEKTSSYKDTVLDMLQVMCNVRKSY